MTTVLLMEGWAQKGQDLPGLFSRITSVHPDTTATVNV